MPRKRMLWPGFFKSKRLAKLTIAAERTFEIIWCYGDDRGRIEDDAAYIWSEGWMTRRKEVSIDDVEDHVDALVANEQLCRYSVGGDSFLHSIAWDEHQSINHPTPSKLPPCREHQPGEWALWWKDDDTATDRWRRAEKEKKKLGSPGVTTGVPNGATTGVEISIESPGSDGISATGVTTGVTEVATTSQFSSVQLSSDQAQIPQSPTDHAEVRQFVRPSQRKQA